MLKFLCLFILIAGALATQTDDERIVGGSAAAVGQFPYQVYLRVSNAVQNLCGGAIIGDRFVLTAGHCTQRNASIPSNVQVVVGAHRRSTGGTTYPLDRIFNHPRFNQRILANDISVLRTARRITFTPLVQPITLPSSDVSLQFSLRTMVSGWGQFRVSMISTLKHLHFLITLFNNKKTPTEWRS